MVINKENKCNHNVQQWTGTTSKRILLLRKLIDENNDTNEIKRRVALAKQVFKEKERFLPINIWVWLQKINV